MRASTICQNYEQQKYLDIEYLDVINFMGGLGGRS
jgi:hypothetical protein